MRAFGKDESENMWKRILALIDSGGGGGGVTGVKGDSESTFRTGNVNLTAANIGALPSDYSGLSALTTPATGDILPVERSGTTYKIDYDALAAAILSRLGAGSDNIVDVANGGTGAATAAAALLALGAPQSNVAWDTQGKGLGLYFYEGASTTDYNLPYQHCAVIVLIHNSQRGIAIAESWPAGTRDLYLNSLHGHSWTGWRHITPSIDTWAAQSTNIVGVWNASFLASGNATVTYDYNGTLRVTVQGVTAKTGTDWLFQLRSAYRENFSSTADAYFTCYLGNTPTTCYLTHDGYLYVKNLNTTDLLSIDIAVAMV